ncbi:hypothetical protein EDC02_7585 [Micromonospora sp. Llam0]|uniref:lysylphosphatidylglycerol synthase transmembrane domain-containing protein n=1 Tax=Micromonospora sp. Llam0 TaxID=2485143 RepID=UPI000FB200E5|nr:lysylphosphatidylglycerol synthase domain-containing protein [Micromonospora sp. Llam0]ROO52646.1 hypothetical protein EDC02_7585 [Micromonospora sp. Llam0]
MHSPARHRTTLLRRALQIAVVGLFAGFIGWALASQWSQVRAAAADLTVTGLLLATAAAAVALWFNFLSWRAILTDFGSRIPLHAGMRIFFVGQLGKYLPGKLWPMLTQARLGQIYRVPGRASVAAALLVIAVSLGTGLLLTVCLLPLVGPDSFDRYWWALLALPVAAVGLWPPVLNWGLTIAMRLARREPMPRPLSPRGIGQSVLWSVLAWLAYGGHIWALLWGLGAADGPRLVFLSIAAFASSWAIGFLLLVAPAGAGPREAALVVILGGSVSQPIALVAAVVSRLLMIMIDVAAPAIAVLLANRRLGGKPPQPDQPGRTDQVDSAHRDRSAAG